ncbi:MAG: tRNA guanosine(34) transglycosylase Tgt [Alphaproteobacteria bacterium]|nr:tRNA guanosine(34) transglycosylase Tgt [Alphaproteobacteria bacterium]
MTCPIPFSVEARHGAARAGVLRAARGEIRTPVFMPVGTQGAIRTLSPLHLASTGSQVILANTYHLHQRPGEDLVEKHGGLHKMMGVDLPILTDSGGFQVFSLKKKRVEEQGVTFSYEVDGRRTFLSPEISMAIQQKLGADIAMVFDECLPHGVDRAYAEDSVGRTTRWELRSKQAHTRPDQSLFGIVQGGFWPDLRRRSIEEICGIGFDGYAIGGLSVGEGHRKMCEVLDYTVGYMPDDHPRYLMGVGRPLDLVEGVARGVDMFDCVIQTRHARSGMFYTTPGRLRVTDRRYRRDMYPVDTSCDCYTCTTFTRAYLHHLFRVGEVLGATLATIHNLHWFAGFMARMRQSIVDGTFEAFRAEVHEAYPEKGSKRSQSKG